VLYLTHRHLYAEASTGLSEELPKNGDVPKSPLSVIGSCNAVGRHDFNLKIEVGSNQRCHRRQHSRLGFEKGNAVCAVNFVATIATRLSLHIAVGPLRPMRRLTLITIGGGLGR
jgi:hypothetical protein